jgi:hypothetical protein
MTLSGNTRFPFKTGAGACVDDAVESSLEARRLDEERCAIGLFLQANVGRDCKFVYEFTSMLRYTHVKAIVSVIFIVSMFLAVQCLA